MLLARFLAVGLMVTGCRFQSYTGVDPANSQRTQPGKHTFSIGVTRQQVRKNFADSWLVQSVRRPNGGWLRDAAPPGTKFAARFEDGNGEKTVEACDVYWVGHTNATSTYYGKQLEYFYFDHEERLIGSESWVED